MDRRCRQVVLLLCLLSPLGMMYYWMYYLNQEFHQRKTEGDTSVTHRLSAMPSTSSTPPSPCSCPAGSYILRDHLPKDQYEDLVQRRAEEYRKHLLRTKSSLNRLLFAPSNSPLQYPIQGYTVVPLQKSLIPGLALHATTTTTTTNYQVSVRVSSGVLAVEAPEPGQVEGQGQGRITLQSPSLADLNNLLERLTYTSTVYHIHTGDLAHFTYEQHEAVFPIVIQRPSIPVLYDMGKDVNSQVTIVTKTFLRYSELQRLISSIRTFYPDMKIIIADDSLKPQKVNGSNIEQYIMPPAQGWFAGRTLGVSQVTTKYLLWVDDDFLFTAQTKIESLVEVMEAMPELDVVGAAVGSGTSRQHFSLVYEEGDGGDGGCLNRKSGIDFQSLPGFPQCSFTDGVVNFLLGRTDAIRRIGFDPLLKRVAHSEFFMDGLGSLLVATCSHVNIAHQPKNAGNKLYSTFRHQNKDDEKFKLGLHFFKNHLKCIRYG